MIDDIFVYSNTQVTMFLMTMHNEVQAIYEDGSLTIYDFGDGLNTARSSDPDIVFKEEYWGSWGSHDIVGKCENGKLCVYETDDRSNAIMGGDNDGPKVKKTEYSSIYEYIKAVKMKMIEPVAVIKCKASSLSDCYDEFHKFFDELFKDA